MAARQGYASLCQRLAHFPSLVIPLCPLLLRVPQPLHGSFGGVVITHNDSEIVARYRRRWHPMPVHLALQVSISGRCVRAEAPRGFRCWSDATWLRAVRGEVSCALNQVHDEQIVAGRTILNIVENPVVQEQVIVQVQVMERIQEQIAETTKVVPRERVQQRTVEQIVRVPVLQIQEQVTVQEIPQVVDSFPPFAEFVAPMCNKVLQEQIVATIQPHVRFQKKSRGSVC